MAVFVQDSFTDTNGTSLTAHTGEVGATWTAKSGAVTITGNRARASDGGGGILYASGVPASAQYDVEGDLVVVSTANMDTGLMGRVPTGSDDGYLLQAADSGFYLYKRVSGTFTLLDSDTSDPLASAETKHAKLELRDAAKKGYVEGVEILSSADNAVTGAGRAGVRIDAGDASTGVHLDNFLATDLSGADQDLSPGGITKRAVGSPTLISEGMLHPTGITRRLAGSPSIPGVGAENGVDVVPPGIDIRVYSPTGGRRNFSSRRIRDFSWTVDRYGGWADFSLNLTARLGELPSLQKNDFVHLYQEDRLRYRGRVYRRSGGDSDTLTLTGYGLSRSLSGLVIDQKFLYLEPVDVRVVVGAIYEAVIAPAIAADEIPDIQLDLADTGVTISELECYQKTVGDALDELVRTSGNRMVWGVRWSELLQKDVLYVRPLSTISTYTLPVPAQRVSSWEGEEDLSEVYNEIHLIGSTPKYPNYEYNWGFEIPVLVGETENNLLTDPDFTARTGWTLSGGASYKASGLSEAAAMDSSMVETDTSGESFNQINNPFIGIQVGHDYRFWGHARREFGGTASTGELKMEWLDSGGGVLASKTIFIVSPSATWEIYEETLKAPVGAEGFRVTGTRLSGSLVWARMGLQDTSVIQSDGWVLEPALGSTSTIGGVDWMRRGGAHTGGYYLWAHVDVEADLNAKDVVLKHRPQYRAQITGNQALRLTHRLKSPRDSAGALLPQPKLIQEIRWFTEGGVHLSTAASIIAATAGIADWTQYMLEAVAPPTAAYAETALVFRGDGQIFVDSITFRDQAAPVNGGVAEEIPDGPIRISLRADDPSIAGDLTVDQQNSIMDWGLRPRAPESVDNVTTVGDGKALALLLLKSHALPRYQGSVSREEDSREFWPGELVTPAGEDGDAISLDPLPIARVQHRFDGKLVSTVELTQERPDAITLFREMMRRARKAQGGGGRGSGSFTSSASSSPGGNNVAAGGAHKDTHVSGGTDAFETDDFLEAVVGRLRETAGPTDLELGAVADGEYLKRSGATIVGDMPSGGGDITAAAADYVAHYQDADTLEGDADLQFDGTNLKVGQPNAGITARVRVKTEANTPGVHIEQTADGGGDEADALRVTGSGGLGDIRTTIKNYGGLFTRNLERNKRVVTTTARTLNLDDGVVYLDSSGGAYAFTLGASPIGGIEYTFICVGANVVTLTPDAAHTINGDADLAMSQYDAVTLVFDSVDTWLVVSTRGDLAGTGGSAVDTTRMKWRGVWSAGTLDYVPNDVVRYPNSVGGTYVCILDHGGFGGLDPPTNPTFWDELVDFDKGIIPVSFYNILAQRSAEVWADMPAAVTALWGDTTFEFRIDLTNAYYLRLSCFTTVAGATGSVLCLQHHNGSAWVTFDGLAEQSSAGRVAIDGTGSRTGPSKALVGATNRTTDKLLRIVGKNGDGAADPAFTRIWIEISRDP